MANIKFSEFTEQSDPANVEFVVGYNGSDNVRIDPANLGGTVAFLTPESQGTVTSNTGPAPTAMVVDNWVNYTTDGEVYTNASGEALLSVGDILAFRSLNGNYTTPLVTVSNLYGGGYFEFNGDLGPTSLMEDEGWTQNNGDSLTAIINLSSVLSFVTTNGVLYITESGVSFTGNGTNTVSIGLNVNDKVYLYGAPLVDGGQNLYNPLTGEYNDAGRLKEVTENGNTGYRLYTSNDPSTYADVGDKAIDLTIRTSASHQPSGDSSIAILNGRSEGLNSIAIGQGNALGNNSIALGVNQLASGFGSIAIGVNNEGQQLYSAAIGNGNEGYGIRSYIYGYQNTVSATDSIAIGNLNNNAGAGSIVMGVDNANTSLQSVSIGYDNTSTGYGNIVVIGRLNEATGSTSTVIGNSSKANNSSTVAIGNQAWATGNESTAVGTSTRAYGFHSSAFGKNAVATNNFATAIGTLTKAYGNDSQAFGYKTIANETRQTVIGTENANNSDAQFIIGNGINGASNSFEILYDGTVIIKDLPSSNSYANDVDAAAGGVPIGGLYRNGNDVKVRLT
jgi:hypothetical protein